MAKSNAKIEASKESKRRGNRSLKKIKGVYQWVNGKILQVGYERTRLMFQDEAGFGRINKPKYCWCYKGLRPTTPCHHIREYRYAYGAVEPKTGDSCYRVLPYCNTDCMNVFLRELSSAYPNDYILLAADGASWHKSKALEIPPNIMIIHLPPYTPEMNPIEQIWKEIRKRGFRNEIFQTLDKVVDRLCDTICSLSNTDTKNITGRNWILSIF
jgi:putative transposase